MFDICEAAKATSCVKTRVCTSCLGRKKRKPVQFPSPKNGKQMYTNLVQIGAHMSAFDVDISADLCRVDADLVQFGAESLRYLQNVCRII